MAFTYKRGPINIRLDVGKASNWLPAVALFLCLSLFALAAVTLLDVNSEPQNRQSANITAVSAQGFSGLRRLLEARGHTVTVNRMEDGPLLDKADLEIITLDNDGGTQTYAYHFEDEDASASPDADTEASAASVADASADSTSANAEADFADYGAAQIPSIARSQHLMSSPLGRAVLVVAPKWQAGVDRVNPRWAMGQGLVHASQVAAALGVLAPMHEVQVPDDDDKAKAPPETEFTRTVRDGDKWVTFDKTSYVITRDQRAVPAKNSDGQAVVNLEGVTRSVVLTPAQGQTLFSAPLKVDNINALQSISGPNLQPVLTGPEGQVILSRVIVTRGRAQTKVPVYLLSDPDLLNNLILADPQKVVSALTLVDQVTLPAKGKAKVIFNLTFNGMSFDHDLLHALARPPFIGVPVCLLIAGLGLMWAAFTRFGPAREPPLEAPLGRGVKTLADNAARLMAITLKETRLGPAYADLVRDAVIKERGYIGALRSDASTETPDDLAERIGKAHRTTDSFTDLKARSGKVLTVHQLIDITLKLHAWKTEIQRAHT